MLLVVLLYAFAVLWWSVSWQSEGHYAVVSMLAVSKLAVSSWQSVWEYCCSRYGTHSLYFGGQYIHWRTLYSGGRVGEYCWSCCWTCCCTLAVSTLTVSKLVVSMLAEALLYMNAVSRVAVYVHCRWLLWVYGGGCVLYVQKLVNVGEEKDCKYWMSFYICSLPSNHNNNNK